MNYYPEHLGLHMGKNLPYSIYSLELGPMENFVYLIHDHKTNRGAVVDPAWDVDKIIDIGKQHNIIVTDILLTHSHHDHINGIASVLDTYDSQIHLLKPEAQFWGQYLDLPTLHHGGDVIMLGDTRIDVLHTPGHTPGSACYRIGNDLITGDTLFVFGCGRCDLSGGDPNEMYETLRKMKFSLPSETIIHPGHNYAEKPVSTMDEQEEGNPFLHFDDVKSFVHYRMHEHDLHRHTPYGPVYK
jgi:glyoxylase-like metal-dependent hydrolase (beta-lactamase superfamily II)